MYEMTLRHAPEPPAARLRPFWSTHRVSPDARIPFLPREKTSKLASRSIHPTSLPCLLLSGRLFLRVPGFPGCCYLSSLPSEAMASAFGWGHRQTRISPLSHASPPCSRTSRGCRCTSTQAPASPAPASSLETPELPGRTARRRAPLPQGQGQARHPEAAGGAVTRD